ncbi:HNH endonuclease [Mycobacterium phage Aminay]|uniref:HNH endonuclease n=1 Tax=Mycobacterium phage Aminay TaxID=2250291 RepID=A0A345KV53_9CAUD|nr:HNH endonuclease [Mycobacterium phage Aminay]AXH46905.1 HNH endonuclease [Mycobacterium phage Aminay]
MARRNLAAEQRNRLIHEAIIEHRAGGRCECDGLCGKQHDAGRCPNKQGHEALDGRRLVVSLMVLQLDEHQGEVDTNLAALCQGCVSRRRARMAALAAEADERRSVEAQHEPLFELTP